MPLDGPFAIVCGDEDLYWRVEDKDSDKQSIIATASKLDASIFYIEKRARPGVFNIAYYGETVLNNAKKSSSKYLTVKCGMMSTNRVPLLQFKGKKATAFVLRHPAKNKHELCIEFWRQDSCFIKLAPHRMKKRGFIAYSREASQIVCVGHPEDEKQRRDVCMRFRLSKIGIEYAKPRAASLNVESDPSTATLKRTNRVMSDGEDEEMIQLEDAMWHFSMQKEDSKEAVEEKVETEDEEEEEEEGSEDNYDDYGDDDDDDDDSN